MKATSDGHAGRSSRGVRVRFACGRSQSLMQMLYAHAGLGFEDGSLERCSSKFEWFFVFPRREVSDSLTPSSRPREALMAREEIGVKRYVVRLSGEERSQLESMLRKGEHAAKTLVKA